MNALSFSEICSLLKWRSQNLPYRQGRNRFYGNFVGKNKRFFNIKGYFYAKWMSLYIILYTYIIFYIVGMASGY